MEMVAKDFNEFIEKSSAAIRTVLNTEIGQQLTNELLNMKLQENPNMTQEEWKQTKAELMTYIFAMFVKDHPEAMQEMAHHTYNELRRL